jgi:hypothetical protein
MTGDELSAVAPACQQVGLDPEGAVLLRYHVNAVYHLPQADAVARVSPARRLAQARRGIEVTRWLIGKGFPATEPLDVEQPWQVGHRVVTFWRYYDQTRRSLPPSRVLAETLRQLHVCDLPPYQLPTYHPLDSVSGALKTYGPTVLNTQEYEFLQSRATELRGAYDQLTSVLGEGLIHADARLGNLLWDGDAVVLGDWDSVSIGPRELDLVITYQGARYGRSQADIEEFARAYGWDVRSWTGYETLRDIRDLHTLSAPLRLAVDRPDVAEELHHRVTGLRTVDLDQRWESF